MILKIIILLQNGKNEFVTTLLTQIERWNVLMGNDLVSAADLIKIIDESRQNALKKVNDTKQLQK